MGNVESNEGLEEEEDHTFKEDTSLEDESENNDANTSHTESFLQQDILDLHSVLTLRGIVMGDGVGKSCLIRHLRGEDPFKDGESSYSTKRQLMVLTSWKISRQPEETIQLHLVEQSGETDILQNISIKGLNPPFNKKTHPTSKEIEFLILMTDPRRHDTLTYTRTILDTLFHRIQEHEGPLEHHLLLSICIMVNFMDLIHQDNVSFTRQDVRSMIQDLYNSFSSNNKDIILSIPIFIFETSMKEISLLKSRLQEFIYIPYLHLKEYHHRQLADRCRDECIIQCKHLTSLESVKQHFRSSNHGNNDLIHIKSQEKVTSVEISSVRKRNVLPSYTKSTKSSTDAQEKEFMIPDSECNSDNVPSSMDTMNIMPCIDLEKFLTNESSDDDDDDNSKEKTLTSIHKNHPDNRNQAVYLSDESESSDDGDDRITKDNLSLKDKSSSPSYESKEEKSNQLTISHLEHTANSESVRIAQPFDDKDKNVSVVDVGYYSSSSINDHNRNVLKLHLSTDRDISPDIVEDKTDKSPIADTIDDNFDGNTKTLSEHSNIPQSKVKKNLGRIYVSSSDEDNFMVYEVRRQESDDADNYYHQFTQSRYRGRTSNHRPSNHMLDTSGIESNVLNDESKSAISAAIQEATESLEKKIRENTITNGTRQDVNVDEDNHIVKHEDDAMKVTKTKKKDKKRSKKTKKKESL